MDERGTNYALRPPRAPVIRKLKGLEVLVGGSPIPSGLIKLMKARRVELSMIYGFTDGLIAGIATINERYGLLSQEVASEISASTVTPALLSGVRIERQQEGLPGEILFRAP